MTIVDTCFLIDLMREDPGAVSLAESVDDLRTTSVSAAEFLYGASVSTHEKVREVSGRFLEYFPVLPFDKEAAIVFADIAMQLRKTGSRISSFDELIAAIVIRHNETLVTRDSHFTDIPGLRTTRY